MKKDLKRTGAVYGGTVKGEFGSRRRKRQRKLRRDKALRKRSLRSPRPKGGADSGRNGSRAHLSASLSRDLLQGVKGCALGPKSLGLSVRTLLRCGPRSPSAGRHHPLCPRGVTSGCHLCVGGAPRLTTATTASLEGWRLAVRCLLFSVRL